MKKLTRYKIDPYRNVIVDLKKSMVVCDKDDAGRYFAKKTNASKKRLQEIKNEIDLLEMEVLNFQANCRHTNAVHQYCGDSGNYDPSRDSYWIEFHCYDCGKYWTEDQ